jgi:hypothetical protein
LHWSSAAGVSVLDDLMSGRRIKTMDWYNATKQMWEISDALEEMSTGRWLMLAMQ